jgi:hypothetical protein
MLAPFIVVLLVASVLMILVGWASEAVIASIRNGQREPCTAVEKGWHSTHHLRKPRRYGVAGAAWTS